MPDFAKLVRISPNKGMTIDGEEFPWYITEDGATVHASRNSLVTVTVAIICERVELDDSRIGGTSEGPKDA